MNDDHAKAGQWVGLFLVGCVLLNFPILILANRQSSLAGIPLLYCYIFAVWLVLILAVVFLARPRSSIRPSHQPDQTSRSDRSVHGLK
jgi:hypothetical protein